MTDKPKPAYLGVRTFDTDEGPVEHVFLVDGEPRVLTTTEIVGSGLVDLVREGVQEGRRYRPEESAAAVVQKVRAGTGVTDGWAWEVFESDGAAVASLSNRPLIDAAVAAGDRVPELHQAVVPLAVIAAALDGPPG